MNKKGQLGWIEFKYFLAGLAIGMVLILATIVLINQGVIPFDVPSFICPVGK